MWRHIEHAQRQRQSAERRGKKPIKTGFDYAPPEESGRLLCMTVARSDTARYDTLYTMVEYGEVYRLHYLQTATTWSSDGG